MNIDRDKLIEMAKEHGFKVEYWLTNPPKPGFLYCTPEQLLSLVEAHAITSMQGDSEPTDAQLITAAYKARIIDANHDWVGKLESDKLTHIRHFHNMLKAQIGWNDRVKGVSDSNHVHLVKQIDMVIEKLGLTQEQAWTEGGSLHAPRICNHIQETLDALAEANNKVAKLLGSRQLSTNTDRSIEPQPHIDNANVAKGCELFDMSKHVADDTHLRVPIVPTQKMLRAGNREVPKVKGVRHDEAGLVWKAMIKAINQDKGESV